MQSPWKVIVAFIGVFIAGAVFGAFFSLGVGARLVNRMRGPGAVAPLVNLPGAKRGPAGAQPPVQGAQVLRRLADRLDLTPAQRERIMPLIQRAVQDFRRQQANLFREDGYILQRLQQDIAKELTAEQRKKLNELQERQRALLRKRLMDAQEMHNARKEGTPAGSEPAAAPEKPADVTTSSGQASSAATAEENSSSSTASTEKQH